MTNAGTMTRAGSILAVRHDALGELSGGAGGGRGGLECAAALGSPGSNGSTRRPRSRRCWPGSKGTGAPSRRWRPIAMIVPSGASKASSVNPAAPKSARMVGVKSGWRRCRVHTTWPPWTQKPRMAQMVRVMSDGLMFPNTPHTRTTSAGTSSVYRWTGRHRPRRSGSGRPRPGRQRRRDHGRRRRGTDRARPAAPRPLHPLDGPPRRRSRHGPGPHTGSPSGSALDG